MAKNPRVTARQEEEPERPPLAFRQILDPMTNKINDHIIMRESDNAFIPFVDGNADYEEYKAWLAEGNKPNPPPEPPPPPVPPTVSHRQFFQALAMSQLITETEALAAMRGEIPAHMDEFIQTLTPAEQFTARMLIAGASEFDINHPLTAKFATYENLTEQDVDDLWRLAASL